MVRYLLCQSCLALNRVPCERVAHEPVCGKCKKTLDLSPVMSVDRRGLEAAVRSSPVPVVVDVWAPWCGPCLRFAPTFQDYAEQHPDAALFLKLDSEAQPDAARSLKIQSIPTLIGFRGGKEVARQSGLLNYAQLGEWMKSRVSA